MTNRNPDRARSKRLAFTMVELVVASAVTAVIFTVALPVFISIYRSWHGIEMRLQADRDANRALSGMIYGVNGRSGLRTVSAFNVTSNSGGWVLTYATGGVPVQTNSITYSMSARTLVLTPGGVVLGSDVGRAFLSAQAHSATVSVRVEKVEGTLTVSREVGTQVSYRNL